jgi:hypothetical protein
MLILTTTQPQTGMVEITIDTINRNHLSGATGTFVMTWQTTKYNEEIIIGTKGNKYNFSIER